MNAPNRSLAQRRDALVKANRIRSARAELKVLLKRDHSLKTLQSIIENPDLAALELGTRLAPVLGFTPPPDWLDTMAVRDLLLACPKVGTVKATRIMRDAWGHLTPVYSRRVHGMNAHYRTRLAAEVARLGARYERTPA